MAAKRSSYTTTRLASWEFGGESVRETDRGSCPVLYAAGRSLLWGRLTPTQDHGRPSIAGSKFDHPCFHERLTLTNVDTLAWT